MVDSVNENGAEVILQGIGVSPGVVAGSAFLVTTEEDRTVERDVEEHEIPREIARFEDALISTRRQLHDIQKQVSEAMGHESASIFDAHLLVVDDRAFVEEVIRGIETRKCNIEPVLKGVAERYADTLAAMNDDYLRERAVDVRDVTRRILRNLSGENTSILTNLDHPCIVIAGDLAPSDTAVMDRENVIGFATDLGSPTSHTAIMARALEIPAIVGLHDLSVRVRSGDTVLIDGNHGVFIINPTHENLDRYGKMAEMQAGIRERLSSLRELPAETRDGYRLLLSANIELPGDIPSVVEHGAQGIGLFRTEYLYLSKDHPPSEEEQFEAYDQVARKFPDEPVIIRTLDLGGDKFVSHLKTPQELNPFLGWRAIRFCLAQPEIFRTQLRAILRASAQHSVKIMYPMISNCNEVIQANRLLEEAKNELEQEGIPFNRDIEVGVMIEIPSAALTADLIAPHVNFFSMGTNDLVQYTLAVDRVNERIAYLYKPTHPAIIKLMAQTIEAGHRHGIWTGVCGEMAGNPLMAPLLLGLGATEFSVSPSSVPLVKQAIRSITFSEASDLAKDALKAESSSDITERCRKLLEARAPELLEFAL